MKLIFGLLIVAANMAGSASQLKCFRYGPAYHKSEGGKVSITGDESDCTASSGGSTACVETCSGGGNQSCYNFYRDSGFGPDGNEGGGSKNYGKSQGGCFTGPVDSAWVGTSCTTEGVRRDGGEVWETRQFCCSTDKCNDNVNSASKLSVIGAVLAILCQVMTSS
mmetsp:Transcript_28307/g.64105  ORF Transcript_28307/g.64105 Transcript_28307/m.64105 type:complete len:165 (+) Transcript_28307:60-554(+)